MKLWLLVTLVVCVVVSTSLATIDGKIRVTLQWHEINGSISEKDFDFVELSDVTGRGLWVAFQQELAPASLDASRGSGKEQSFPGIYFNGQFI